MSASVNECVAAAEDGQEQRQARNLLRAQQAFRGCAKAACPKVIAQDCAAWLREVDAELPSLVVRVVDVNGATQTIETLRIDEHVIAADGLTLPVPLDPGSHTVMVDAGGHTFKQTVTLHLRERERIVTFTSLAPAPPVEPLPRSNTMGWSLVGASAAALASFTYFGTAGRQRADHLRTSCAPDCTDAQVKDARDRLWKADASLGLAVGLGAVGTWLLLRPAISHRAEKVAGAPGLRVRLGTNNATLVWFGRF